MASASTSARYIPVRAIPSTLARKSTPPIPSPTELYEPLVKKVLQHRLGYSIFLQSSLLTWAVMTVSGIWQRRPISIARSFTAPFNPMIILATLVVWIFAALPVILLRKKMLTSTRSTATSPANALSSSLAKLHIRRAFLVYITSALVLFFAHVLLSYAVESADPKLRLFVRSKKHPYYLNGRLIFIFISQFVTAIMYGIRNILLDRFVFKWRIAAQGDATSLKVTLSDVFRTFIVSGILSLLVLPLTATIFAVTRFFLPILYKIPFVPLFLRPFTAHFLRGSLTIFLSLRHFDLLQRVLHLGFVSLFVWDIVDTLFDSNVAKQISVASLTDSPNQTLISGISSQNLTYKYFAYCDLCTVAEDLSSPAVTQRKALFADLKHTPTLWSHFIHESLLLLEQHYQLFLRRGNPAPPPPSSPSIPIPAPAPNPGLIPSRTIPLLRKGIFKDASQDVADIMSNSDGPISHTNANAIKIPKIFLSEIQVEVMPKVTKQEVHKGAENVNGVMETTKRRINEFACVVYSNYLPSSVTEHLDGWSAWWGNDRMSKNVEKSLLWRELDAVIIEVISHLTCASLTEDQYGVVQRDIPRILETFLSFLSAIEEYRVQVNSLDVPPPRPDEQREGDGEGEGEGDGVREAAGNVRLTPKEWEERMRLHYEVEQSKEVLDAMGAVLKEAVGRIVRTFGNKLKVFKLRPRTAQKLQVFLDYC